MFETIVYKVCHLVWAPSSANNHDLLAFLQWLPQIYSNDSKNTCQILALVPHFKAE